MAFTFRGTYTQNRGDAAAAGTVAVKTRAGATLDTATLDENGSYELVLDAQEGEMRVVETITGVAVRSYEVGVSQGSVTDTSRDIGYVGPGGAQSGASVADIVARAGVYGSSAPGNGAATTIIVPSAEAVVTFNHNDCLPPQTIPAGSGNGFSPFLVPPVDPEGDFEIVKCEIMVTNGAGTEKLSLFANSVDPADANTPNMSTWGTSRGTVEDVGSDLALSGDGLTIDSTAGGQFMASVVWTLRYTP